ncbi:efflux RND transporter periplasmic adaptor subunit [Flavilitoribacter nigricans]|uniref:Efflux transporter periplasmic adaptor subunit n=1 Tax=Flavilitoribacter nigricans (strain ATCC 23147 / DSM 23189 / NBRC 102662 / NCIMB 1420 / SS-2) TaxID=1122177 RepID=A0A2D0N816_FLAN2|nr:efflux RND transporter periplasmic adaptor subunit [Flavilitoribacter nigricans]PHN04652.1 efflux transporter periplasmic adaptor subunit [Flavilitoribacter nigricans DSM 23189 = NBRC 102662]
MKHLFSFLAIALLFVACNPTVEEVPADLEGKKAYLQEKKEELNKLTLQIAQLESEIAKEDPTFGGKKVRLVTIDSVNRSDFEHFVEIQGSIEADDMVDVTSETAGRILSLKVKEGDPVRQGQLVAELDLESLKKQIAELETSLSLANTVYERQKRLWDQNIGSEMQYLEAKNNKERLEKSLETLQFNLTKSKVYAPISGVVENEVLQSGEIASPGAPIVQILNTNRLKAKASVPESYLKSVTQGAMVKVSVPALDWETEARVTQIGRVIDPSNRTFAVEVALSDPQRRLKPNLLAYVYFKDYEEEDVVTIPLDQVQEEVGGKKYVFVVDRSGEDPIARKVYVKIGRTNSEGAVVITEGLNGDEELIMDGARGLVDEDLIDITNNAKTEANNG